MNIHLKQTFIAVIVLGFLFFFFQGLIGNESAVAGQVPQTVLVASDAIVRARDCIYPEEFTYYTSGDETHYTSNCFPGYYYKDEYEGYFLESTNQPIPMLQRYSCGHFDILVVFFDTPTNRNLLLQNEDIPSDTRALVTADVESALRNLFLTHYTSDAIFSHLAVAPEIVFAFDVLIISPAMLNYTSDVDLFEVTPSGQTVLAQVASTFQNYDAVLFIQDLPNSAAGYGIGKWPTRHPLFNRNNPLAFKLDPLYITPGTFYNELFRRNVPIFLAEYTLGAESSETINGITYITIPVYNPRTGFQLERSHFASLSNSLNGWGDVDGDGIMDCKDRSIASTPDNIDADWIPDMLDPDLSKNNGPYFHKTPPALFDRSSLKKFMEKLQFWK